MNELSYNLRNYILTIGCSVLRGQEQKEYVTIRSKTDPTMGRRSEYLILQCQTRTFENFMNCLDAGAGKIELCQYVTSPGVYTRASVYDELTENLIGTFSMNKIILEHRKSTANKEEIRQIHHLLFTLYQIQKRYDLKINGVRCGHIPENIPEYPISFEKFEYQPLLQGNMANNDIMNVALSLECFSIFPLNPMKGEIKNDNI